MDCRFRLACRQDGRPILQRPPPRAADESGGRTYVSQLDDEDNRQKGSLEQTEETVVWFVGVSGIGKSTLLNTIVAQAKTFAPSGGVVRLTPFQQRAEVETSGSSEAADARDCVHRRANSAGVAQSSA